MGQERSYGGRDSMKIFTMTLTLGFLVSSLGFAERKSEGSRGGMRLKARSKSSESSSPSMSSEKHAKPAAYLNYLPFGTGQFVQDRTTSGTIFGISQGLFLGLAFNASQNISRANDDVNSVMKTTDPATAAKDPAALAYLNNNEKYVKENQANLKIFTGMFLLSYGIGVFDAVFDPFGSMSLSAKKKRVSEDEGKPSKRGGKKSISEEKTDETDSRVSFFYYQGEEKPGYGLNLKSEF